MTTRKSVKAKPLLENAFCIAYLDSRKPYFLPSSTASRRNECVREFVSLTGMSWPKLKKDGYRVIPVTISPRRK